MRIRDHAPPPLANGAAHDIFVALRKWVEKGIAPTRVVAAQVAAPEYLD